MNKVYYEVGTFDFSLEIDAKQYQRDYMMNKGVTLAIKRVEQSSNLHKVTLDINGNKFKGVDGVLSIAERNAEQAARSKGFII